MHYRPLAAPRIECKGFFPGRIATPEFIPAREKKHREYLRQAWSVCVLETQAQTHRTTPEYGVDGRRLFECDFSLGFIRCPFHGASELELGTVFFVRHHFTSISFSGWQLFMLCVRARRALLAAVPRARPLLFDSELFVIYRLCASFVWMVFFV